MKWGEVNEYRQFAKIGALSVALHIVAFVLALKIPSLVQPELPQRVIVQHKTPLYFPQELTQKAKSATRRTFLFITNLQVILCTGAPVQMARNSTIASVAATIRLRAGQS